MKRYIVILLTVGAVLAAGYIYYYKYRSIDHFDPLSKNCLNACQKDCNVACNNSTSYTNDETILKTCISVCENTVQKCMDKCNSCSVCS